MRRQVSQKFTSNDVNNNYITFKKKYIWVDRLRVVWDILYTTLIRV